ncbi:MAG: ATP-grasp domain-containing protein [Pseudomonadota bacterium]|nr:MAG: ATP-grasp domain-containing protein [Pseudomonadota bacterium]
MKIAVIYSTQAGHVIQHRGPLAHEEYPLENVQRIVDALRVLEHEVVLLEGDQDIIERLQNFFGEVPDGQWPGLVFNLAFGMQGQLRYCQMPALLDTLGLPYIGSSPWGHALASDKAAAKALFQHYGLPTPAFAVMRSADDPDPGMSYPLVVKPVAEASSFGLHLVHTVREMRDAVRENLVEYQQPVLVEQFVDGRELSISILGNGSTAEPLPAVEVILSTDGLPVYTREDKNGTALRRFELLCPAAVSDAINGVLQRVALQAFDVLHCRDWARVEFRMDEHDQLYLLEVNTLPGLGVLASLPVSAKAIGLGDLPAVVNRLVQVATARYRDSA